jgi:hypothetical protein
MGGPPSCVRAELSNADQSEVSLVIQIGNLSDLPQLGFLAEQPRLFVREHHVASGVLIHRDTAFFDRFPGLIIDQVFTATSGQKKEGEDSHGQRV